MRIAARNERNTDFVPSRQISFLSLVKPAQQTPAAEFPADANRSINITVKGAERLTFERNPIVGVEHLCDHRRTGVILAAKGAEETGDVVTDDGDHRAEVLCHLRGLLRCELRGQEPLFALLVGKVRDEV